VQAAERRKREAPPENTKVEDPEFEPGKRLARELVKFAWEKYKEHAWGADELAPVSKIGANFFGNHPLALTMVDTLDTLLICDLHNEYKEAASYVLNNLSFDKVMKISLFESNIRIVGGLLSVFGLTGDGRFASKAFDLAQRYLSTFKEGSVLPSREVDLMKHVRLETEEEKGVAAPQSCITAEPGTLIMEWSYMSYIIKDPTLRNKAYAILERFNKIEGYYEGLLPRVTHLDHSGILPGSKR
jgi:mannosyl-oligosaccharide alpha-1,2-mannosidase